MYKALNFDCSPIFQVTDPGPVSILYINLVQGGAGGLRNPNRLFIDVHETQPREEEDASGIYPQSKEEV